MSAGNSATLSTSCKIKAAGIRNNRRAISPAATSKVVLAKWLARDCEVLIFDEPTRGIDVRSKYEIYLLMNELAAQGKAIVMISSATMPGEVLGMADRIPGNARWARDRRNHG